MIYHKEISKPEKTRYTREINADSSRTCSYPDRNSEIRRLDSIHTWSSGRTTRIECNELSAGLITFLSPISGKHFKYKFILFVKNRNKNISLFCFYIKQTKLPECMHSPQFYYQSIIAKSLHQPHRTYVHVPLDTITRGIKISLL